MEDLIFTPVTFGALQLANRVVMSPMTRSRAGAGDAPTAMMVEYYRQRAAAGLIVTEGVFPCPEGKGYWRTPGIHSQQQIDGWAKVAEAVHGEGGLVSMQLMHCGRAVAIANRGYDADVVAPSALPCPDLLPGPDGVPIPTATPRALGAEELPTVAEQYAQAARNARAAGIDAVELHCSSGYLINTFLNPASNHRDDEFGGSPENRARFPIMVVQAMADAIGADRVGVRISPGNPYNGMDPSDPAPVFAALLDGIDPLRPAYLHISNMRLPDLDTLAFARQHWSGPIAVNNTLTLSEARELLANGGADAVSFGRDFIANPDLVARFRANAPLAEGRRENYYTGEERGYIDYPSYTAA
ncbi:putative oxidoreductase [Caenibius tardaugens NBRC 16725]|uniref:Putative oxidoreductase n=1 Tax=Caenibius tardaugens NBRC 16725 TaxID=1219035 RepID=U2YM44_9SPHN|nr:alkene reductase [Caenibius tardaugens]AZI36836.1 alkene reductase [Caenibius tardaugens NBRC 16725]GAD49517.1 putative oxidoreductase [Caenibius tardaugens NBRC 16725]